MADAGRRPLPPPISHLVAGCVSVRPAQLDAIAKVGELFTVACADLVDTIHYLRWQVLNHNANYLSAGLVNLYFEFFGKQMR